MIERLSGRRAFDRLRADGLRSGRGPLRLVSLLDPAELAPSDHARSARVGYAIPRSVGTAVERNRTRRRLRAVIAELDGEGDGVPPGDHLIRVTRSIDHWSHAKLRHTMTELLLSEVSR